MILENLHLLDVLLALSVGLVLFLLVRYFTSQKGKKNEPPRVPNLIPYFGSFVGFAAHPVKFIQNNAEKYGNIFTATILGKEVCHC